MRAKELLSATGSVLKKYGAIAWGFLVTYAWPLLKPVIKPEAKQVLVEENERLKAKLRAGKIDDVMFILDKIERFTVAIKARLLNLPLLPFGMRDRLAVLLDRFSDGVKGFNWAGVSQKGVEGLCVALDVLVAGLCAEIDAL